MTPQEFRTEVLTLYTKSEASGTDPRLLITQLEQISAYYRRVWASGTGGGGAPNQNQSKKDS